MKAKTLKAAFPLTIPVLAGYVFLGIAYGILASANGIPVFITILLSIIVFGGSLQFVAVSVLTSPFAPLRVLIMALLIHTRHVFYGISMLEKYKNMGAKKPYLIFGLTDETFSVNYYAKIPPEINKGNFMFTVTLLDQIYWITGSAIGATLGSLIPFNFDGIDFVMTAMFVCIFVERLEKKENFFPALIGIVSSVAALLIFDAGNFLVPAMIAIVVLLFVLRKPLKIDSRSNKKTQTKAEGEAQ